MKINTLKKINRPIKFSGLSSGQFGTFASVNVLIILVMILQKQSFFVIVGTVGGIVLISSLIFKKLKEEHKNGNPDYLTGLLVKRTTPSKITDRKRVFKILIDN